MCIWCNPPEYDHQNSSLDITSSYWLFVFTESSQDTVLDKGLRLGARYSKIHLQLFQPGQPPPPNNMKVQLKKKRLFINFGM